MKEILLTGSLLIVSSCTYLEEHPEVVEEVELVAKEDQAFLVQALQIASPNPPAPAEQELQVLL